MSSVYQSSAHSLGILYENAVQMQKMSSISAQAAANQGVIQLYTAGTMSSAAATAKIASTAGGGNSKSLIEALIILKLLDANI